MTLKLVFGLIVLMLMGVIETQRQTIQHQREELAGQLQTLGIAQHSVVSCNKDFQTLVTSCKK